MFSRFALLGLTAVLLLNASGCSRTQWTDVRRHFYHSGPPEVAGRYAVRRGAYVQDSPRSLGMVFGRVLDREMQEYLRGATVSAGGRDAVTDSLGRFSLALPHGSYSVRVSAPGYEPLETEPVEVAFAAVEVLFDVMVARLIE